MFCLSIFFWVSIFVRVGENKSLSFFVCSSLAASCRVGGEPGNARRPCGSGRKLVGGFGDVVGGELGVVFIH